MPGLLHAAHDYTAVLRQAQYEPRAPNHSRCAVGFRAPLDCPLIYAALEPLRKNGLVRGASLEPPSPDMDTEAVSTGFYESPGWNQKYRRIQILTIEALLHGVRCRCRRLRKPSSKRRRPKAPSQRSRTWACRCDRLRHFMRGHFLPLRAFASAAAKFSATLKRTILATKSSGKGWSRGNCTEPLAPL